ncbi:MAG: cytidine deaminase [Crocinitomicaceae bacterium]
MEKEFTLKYSQFDHWKDLPEKDHLLVDAANKIMQDAYAPYSNFKVGAALLLEDGTVITGSNQENIAYPSGLCAERVALFFAGANHPNIKVDTLCIVAKGDLVDVETILSPCGGCRQVMVETEKRQNKSFRVILVSQNNITIVTDSAASLLPLAFGI